MIPNLVIMTMITCHTTARYCNAMVRDTNVTLPEHVVRDVNTTLILDCKTTDVLLDHVQWSRDNTILLNGSTRVTIDQYGRLLLILLKETDSGEYKCVANDNKEKTYRVKIISVKSDDRLNGTSTNATIDKLSGGLYLTDSLSTWMTSVACIVLIAMVTIVIIVTYLKITTPKKGDLSKRFETTKENVKIEVVAEEQPKLQEELKTAIRQRKSTTSLSSSQDFSFLHHPPKYTSTTKHKSNELDLGEGSPSTPQKDGETAGKHLRKTKSDSRVSEDNASDKMPPLKVRSDPELTRLTPEQGQRKETSGKRQHSPGKMLRKMASEPYCVKIKNPSKSTKDIAEGQALRKVSSEPARTANTIYSGPFIKASLGYDKHALYAKTQKLKKSKSEKSIDKASNGDPGDGINKKTKRRKGKKTASKHDPEDFSNPFYSSVEDISASKARGKAEMLEDDDDDPVYRDFSEIKHLSSRRLKEDKCLSSSKMKGKNLEKIIDNKKHDVKAHGIVQDIKREKQIENLGFSFSEDLEDCDYGFDEEPAPNDRMYQNNQTIDTNYPVLLVRELPQLPKETEEESLYDELYSSTA